VESVLKKEAVDEDSQWSRLQNFMLDATKPLVAAFEELSAEQPDGDRVSAAVQQALLFLGNASAHFNQLRRGKILKKLNPDVQSLAKDADFSQAAPYLFGEGIEEKVKNRVDAVRMLKRSSASCDYGNKQFFRRSSSQGGGLRRGRMQQSRYQPYQNQKGFAPNKKAWAAKPKGRQ